VAMSRDKSISLIGAPTDIGAGARGGSMGPEALRVAGLHEALNRLGYGVIDRGNLAGPSNWSPKPVRGYRHLKEVVAWCAAVRDAFKRDLDANNIPILLGGDHSLSIGSIAAVSDYCREGGKAFSVLWLDAHADFNTPQTTQSGNLHGMPVAVVTGQGPTELLGVGSMSPMIDIGRVVQVGIRSVDHVEKELVRENGLTVIDMREIDERGMRSVMDGVLQRLGDIGGHLHVSLDVDFLDPSIAPGVATQVPGGPTYREAQLCMEMIYDSGLMGSLDIAELNPAHDDQNRTAELIVDLVESLFGEQILSRHHSTL